MNDYENSTAVQPAARAPHTEVRTFLEREDVLERIDQAATAHLDVRRLVKMALNQATRTPRLFECSPVSWAKALQQAAEVGLEPGPLGHVYLIPRKNGRTGDYEVDFQIGARGWVELARRHADVLTIDSHIVHHGDAFEFAYGVHPTLEHRPELTQAERPIVAAYAIAFFTNGHRQFEVMTRSEIDSIRERSASSNDGPWVTDYAEMARKTVERRLCKRLPLQLTSQAVNEEPVAELEAGDA